MSCNSQDEQNQGGKIGFSSAILSRSCKIDELLVRRVCHIQEADCKSWIQRGNSKSLVLINKNGFEIMLAEVNAF